MRERKESGFLPRSQSPVFDFYDSFFFLLSSLPILHKHESCLVSFPGRIKSERDFMSEKLREREREGELQRERERED